MQYYNLFYAESSITKFVGINFLHVSRNFSVLLNNEVNKTHINYIQYVTFW